MKTMKYSMYSLLLLAFISIWGSSCKKQIANDIQSDAFGLAAGKNNEPRFADNNMVMYWNEKAAIVLNGPFTPPAQERYFAMIQIAVHDALNAIKPKYESFAMTTIRSQHANADAAVAAAAYWSIKKMGLASTFPVDNWYAVSLNSIPDGESKELGKTLGMQSADAIIGNRANDNFEQANVQVPRPDGINPGAYKSTLPFSNPGLPKIKALHQWGLLMKPFVTESNYQFRPEAPYALNTPQYLADYNEVKTKGARVNHTRTADESEIGIFWVERATIGWNRFARNIIMSKKLDAWKTARLFALLHTAMTDGTSGCFEAKYYYLYWRPETAIRLGDNDGVPATIGDATWLPSNTEGPNPLTHS